MPDLPDVDAWTWALLAMAIALLAALVYLQRRHQNNRRRALQELREKIARDFHDELGGKLTTITLYTELARRELAPRQTTVLRHLDRVSQASSAVYDSMKDLIWSLHPERDQLTDLWNRLHLVGQELFVDSGVAFHATAPAPVPHRLLSPDQKRHILLIFKEAMNNALRHAHCSAVHLELALRDKELHLSFADNGRGLHPEENGQGEGLKNMRVRARRLGADLRIESNGQGTRVTLRCKI